MIEVLEYSLLQTFMKYLNFIGNLKYYIEVVGLREFNQLCIFFFIFHKLKSWNYRRNYEKESAGKIKKRFSRLESGFWEENIKLWCCVLQYFFCVCITKFVNKCIYISYINIYLHFRKFLSGYNAFYKKDFP